ncbi:MAG: RagB/SusD family nutrient uptake outer membrane protein [Flavobacteriaceae bacterium]
MKKIISILLVFATLASCSSILEEESFSELTPDSFLNNYAEANQAVIGVYAMLTEQYYYKQGFLVVTGYSGDEFYHHVATFATPFYDGTLASDNDYVEPLWDNIAVLRDRANYAISILEETDKITDDEKQLLIARVKFIRALNYYNAVRLWGDIPLLKEYSLEEDDLYPVRTPKFDVYTFIEDDLLEAAHYLPVTETEYGFPTKGAALGLLAKVHMSQDEWIEANSILNDFFDISTYSLLPNYQDVFNISNENNAEEIFAIQFTYDSNNTDFAARGSMMADYFLPNNIAPIYVNLKTRGQMITQHASYDRYVSNDYVTDTRNQIFLTSYPNINNPNATVKRYPDNPNTRTFGPGCNKYQDPGNSNDRNFNNNLYILRYADILLMKAEIENEINNGPTTAAYNAFNEVRLRSNETELETGLSQDEFRDAISDERGIEFFGEFQRWFDLTRMKKSNGDSYYKFLKEKVITDGKFNAANGPHNNWAAGYFSKYELMPIPAAEIRNNPNISVSNQNPGY